MQIPFVGFQPIRTSEHMAASGVFALVIAAGAFNYIQTRITKAEFKFIFIFAHKLLVVKYYIMFFLAF